MRELMTREEAVEALSRALLDSVADDFKALETFLMDIFRGGFGGFESCTDIELEQEWERVFCDEIKIGEV